MKPSLSPGLSFEFSYCVPEQKTVPYVYSESALFQTMPHVRADDLHLVRTKRALAGQQ